jgi:rubrerythrin
MSDLNSVNEILDFAIAEEQKAADLYQGLAQQMGKPALAEIFVGFAKEELGHKSKLEAVKDGKKLLSSASKVADLKIGDYLVDVELSGDIDYQKALTIAMKKEKAAFRLYSDLAAQTDDASIKDLLLGLAQEEAKHKLRFEVEYDDFILTEN